MHEEDLHAMQVFFFFHRMTVWKRTIRKEQTSLSALNSAEDIRMQVYTLTLQILPYSLSHLLALFFLPSTKYAPSSTARISRTMPVTIHTALSGMMFRKNSVARTAVRRKLIAMRYQAGRFPLSAITPTPVASFQVLAAPTPLLWLLIYRFGLTSTLRTSGSAAPYPPFGLIRFLFVGSQFCYMTSPTHGSLLPLACLSLHLAVGNCGRTFTGKMCAMPGTHKSPAAHSCRASRNVNHLIADRADGPC